MKYSKEQIKELILTDYLDGRLNEAAKKEIDAMISQDPELVEFLDSVLRSVHDPLNNIEQAQPPEHIWQNIKDQIQQAETSFAWDHWIQRAQKLWARPRLSFALGSVMTALIIVLWAGTGKTPNPSAPMNAQSNKNLMLLAGGGMVNPEDISNGFGTSIEDYFL